MSLSPISGFTAIPNPQMLAFMPIQSYLMMYFAGSAWQFGKRKISAKSNEEFNSLTMEKLLQEHSIELKNVIPTLEKSLKDVTPLIEILIVQYGEFIKEAIAAIKPALEAAIPAGSLAGQAIHPSAGSSTEDILSNIIKMLIPSLPSAEARLSQSSQEAQRKRLETGLVQKQADRLAEANKRIADFKKQQLLNKPSEIITPIPVHQIIRQSEISRGQTIKKAAGQTQRLEMRKLLRLTTDLARQIKGMKAQKFQNPFVIKATTTNEVRLRRIQEQIIGLKLRYRF